MPRYCGLDIELTIPAPFICASAGDRQWGIDSVFNRDHLGRPSIPGSHIKGKLREALKELLELDALAFDLDHWFGRAPQDGDYSAHKGLIHISDFIFQQQETASRATHRIRIHQELGVAHEGALMAVEDLFGRGQETVWGGAISFSTETESQVDEVKSILMAGMKWITHLGAFKGSGYGRLKAVKCGPPKVRETRAKIVDIAPTTYFGLKIHMESPFMVGKVRSQDKNYLESLTIIPGNVIKGALAQCLRRRLLLKRNTAITKDALTGSGLETLAEYFEAIRFTHAFPTHDPDVRPVQPPLTLVEAQDAFSDVALAHPYISGDNRAPAFGIDSKNRHIIMQQYGWAWPRTIMKTKTAIEPLTRRAGENQLYTYQYVCPENSDGKKIIWAGNVYLPEDLEESVRSRLAGELMFVLENWLDLIGKRDSVIEKVVFSPASCRPDQEGPDCIKAGLVIVTLQTDTLLLNPWAPNLNRPQGLVREYQTYWHDVSDGLVMMKDFFAAQKLAGGYLGQKAKIEGQYRPFLLTEAGSVFILECRANQKAGEVEKRCRAWLKKGLPSPSWACADTRYGKSAGGRLDWKRCPFTPENGFGEMVINLPCHWTSQWRGKGPC